MLSRSDIFAKHLKDLRFRRTEKAILAVFVKKPDIFNITQFSSQAKISRPTFYLHHKSITSIVDDYEKYLRKELKKYFKERQARGPRDLKTNYRDALFFVLRHKQMFEILALKRGAEGFNLITESLRANFETEMCLPKNCERIFKFYKREIGIVLFEWYENNFTENQLGAALQDIMYFSKTARAHYMPLVR